MRLSIGCDEIAIGHKNEIKKFLLDQKDVNIESIADFGVDSSDPVDYPDIAEQVALSVANGESDRGILICGTGIGMAIVANKIPGIRAALVYDPYSAERAQKSNNAQIITLGSLTIGTETAKYLVKIWLNSSFVDGRSTRKVEKINKIDAKFHKKNSS